MSVDQLKKAIKDETLTYGQNKTLAGIKLGKVKAVFLATDCNPDAKGAVREYGKHTQIEVVELDINSAEVAALCKRQHPVGILSY